MEKANEDHWRELSEHILTDIKEWRRSHPKATFREIEDEVHKRISRLEAQLIQDTAQESQSRAWSGANRQERPCCPSRPSAHHPWKRGPACPPKEVAKR